MTNKEAIAYMKENDERIMSQVCTLMKEYNDNVVDCLADVVASLCDVEKMDLLSDVKHIKSSQARWLYWYVYRQLTNDSYDAISKRFDPYRHFTVSCICNSVVKMSMLIASDTIWTKRYAIIRRVIDAANNVEEIN